jgi:hypothetical protein
MHAARGFKQVVMLPVAHAVRLLLPQICAVLDIAIDEDALRAADGKPNDGTGMEEDRSEEVRSSRSNSWQQQQQQQQLLLSTGNDVVAHAASITACAALHYSMFFSCCCCCCSQGTSTSNFRHCSGVECVSWVKAA